MFSTAISKETLCYHCGEICIGKPLALHDRSFCCEGCRMVYKLLNEHALNNYYELNSNPGLSQRKIRKDKFAFLDDPSIAAKLVSFRNESQLHITLYLPQIHCSSCLYLLENLHRLDSGVISCAVDFGHKEARIVIQPEAISLRQLAELLARIGYEPYISLNDLNGKRPSASKKMISQLGVAGFCFGNIMLLSFPEYLGIGISEVSLQKVFHWVCFVLSLPVFFFSALPFYESSWKSLQHRYLNIDAPIALAIIITFGRSTWEVITGNGAGYFDSMTGIVFFMLAGRWLQGKTYQRISFERDYTSYFPIAVSVLKNGIESPTALPEIRPGDTLVIHHDELIPADGILTKGNAFIDYSFVTGESMSVPKETGELLYAGGKQTGANIEMLLLKEVSQSYLTSLWEKSEKKIERTESSFVNKLSRYFSYTILLIAAGTAAYWYFNNVARIWPAVTSIFIIACPCALLLSSSFTNGNILRILGRNHFFLRDANVIEQLGKATHIVFDKTGTLTSSLQHDIVYEGNRLSPAQERQLAALAGCSNHPLSRALSKHFNRKVAVQVLAFKETLGEGIEGFVEEELVKIGTCRFVCGQSDLRMETAVFVSFENNLHGWFRFRNHYRDHIYPLISELRKSYKLSALSGDNETEKENLQTLFGSEATILFNQKPEDKLNYIRRLQQRGEQVIMIGDGLNDAGALQQSDAGIAVCDQVNNFTPASDAIIEAVQLKKLNEFIRLCKANRRIILASFGLSILYNMIGLFFAVQGTLSPLIAAVLMPSSSLCIFLVTFGSSNVMAKNLRL